MSFDRPLRLAPATCPACDGRSGSRTGPGADDAAKARACQACGAGSSCSSSRRLSPLRLPPSRGPTVVQVKPEPSQPDWVKVCGKDQGSGKEICYTTRDFVSDQGQPVLAVAVYDVKGDPNRMVRFLMPLGLLLQPGVRYAVDQGKAESGRFAICFRTAASPRAPLNDAVIAAMKKGTALQHQRAEPVRPRGDVPGAAGRLRQGL